MRTLREQLGLEVRCFGHLDLEGAPRGPAPPKPVRPRLAPLPTTIGAIGREHVPRPHDGSRTHAEARTAYRAEEGSDIGSSRFSESDITSGLPDDSREADEKAAEGHLRDIRARVKQARAMVATTSGLAETLAADCEKAARFYARFGITAGQFHRGVPSLEATPSEAGSLLSIGR